MKKEIKIDEDIIKVCLKIAKSGEGGLIIVGDNIVYTPLVNQVIPTFKITDNLKLLEQIAKIDGAVIINNKRYVTAYGVKVKSDKVLKGFGTRHSAALSSSFNKDTTSYLISEEENKVKIFNNGKIIMQIDSNEKNIDKNLTKAIHIFESIGVGAVGSIGVSTLVPTLGIALIPGVIIFGSAHFIIKLLTKKDK
jgi:DNA integrity scanning protein DisA with diadenylate cyclase activity